MDFKEALTILGIEDYGKRIFNSNSHDELFHLADYIFFAEFAGKAEWFQPFFNGWFKETVQIAEKEWERPESVFQHIKEIWDYEISKKKEI